MKKRIIGLLLVTSLTGGCATVMNGNSQTINVDSTPSGQKYVITKEDHGIIKKGTTPDQITLKRYNLSYYHIKVGDISKKIQVHGSKWMFGNLLFGIGGFIPGMVVDLITGDQGYYNDININTIHPVVKRQAFTRDSITN